MLSMEISRILFQLIMECVTSAFFLILVEEEAFD